MIFIDCLQVSYSCLQQQGHLEDDNNESFESTRHLAATSASYIREEIDSLEVGNLSLEIVEKSHHFRLSL